MFAARFYQAGSAKSILVHPSLEGDQLIIDEQIAFPVSRLSIEIGGEMKDKVVVRCLDDAATLLFDSTEILDALVAQTTSQGLSHQAAALISRMRGKKKEQLRYWGTIGGVLVAIAAVGLLAFNTLIDWSIAHFDPQTETRISEFATKGMNLDKDKQSLARVTKIGKKLVAQLKDQPYKYTFHVKDDKEINACAYPGGFVVVNWGLIKKANDDQLAGVMGHEIGHVVHRDTLKRAFHSMGTSACLGLICGAGPDEVNKVADALTIAQKLDSFRFSRKQESDADLVGVDIAVKAGYDGNGLVQFFHQLEKESSGLDKLMPMLSDHPLSNERAAAIQQEINRLKQHGPE